MPGELDVYEYASRIGALDDDGIYVQRSGDAHTRREIARNANRQAGTGYPLFAETWRADGTAGEGDPGKQSDWATWPAWQRIVAGVPCPHKPNLRTGVAKVRASLASGATLYMQFATMARPHTEAPNLPGSTSPAPNVLELAGTGASALYTLTGIPLNGDIFEYFTISVASPYLGALVSGIGTPTGTVDNQGPGYITDNGSIHTGSQLTALQRSPGRFLILCRDSAGNLIFQPRPLVRVSINAAAGTDYYFDPPLSQAEARAVVGSIWELHEGVAYELHSIVVWEEDAY